VFVRITGFQLNTLNTRRPAHAYSPLLRSTRGRHETSVLTRKGLTSASGPLCWRHGRRRDQCNNILILWKPGRLDQEARKILGLLIAIWKDVMQGRPVGSGWSRVAIMPTCLHFSLFSVYDSYSYMYIVMSTNITQAIVAQW
jgi:hypothetical protein